MVYRKWNWSDTCTNCTGNGRWQTVIITTARKYTMYLSTFGATHDTASNRGCSLYRGLHFSIERHRSCACSTSLWVPWIYLGFYQCRWIEDRQCITEVSASLHFPSLAFGVSHQGELTQKGQALLSQAGQKSGRCMCIRYLWCNELCSRVGLKRQYHVVNWLCCCSGTSEVQFIHCSSFSLIFGTIKCFARFFVAQLLYMCVSRSHLYSQGTVAASSSAAHENMQCIYTKHGFQLIHKLRLKIQKVLFQAHACKSRWVLTG